MTTTTITTKSQDGPRDFRFEVTRTRVELYINEKLFAEGRVGRLVPSMCKPEFDHAILDGATNNIAPLGHALTKQVLDAQAELQAAFDLTPAGRMVLLRRQRSEILDRRSACLEMQDRKMERAFATSVFNGPDYHKQYDAIQAELDAFDAEHPEVIGAIKTERAAELANSFIGRNID